MSSLVAPVLPLRTWWIGDIALFHTKRLTPGDIQVAQEHLREFGFDPGPINGVFTPETQAAVRAYQARYGVEVTGLLDRATRRGLLPGFDQRPFP
jgi:peptidoglycan hydrolase-like protein with peptidoglycan-binding domain